MNDLNAIYFTARQLPPDQRPAYLARACGGDAALQARLERMLAVADQAEDFFTTASPVAGRDDRPPEPGPTAPRDPGNGPEIDRYIGQQIGRYRILERLGEGGCGVVYVAEQTEPIRRRVALKLIKPGMDTRQVVARFEAERQALAMMDHPNIARVLDGGSTDDAAPPGSPETVPGGRPYFVMELVRGIRITDYCDRAHLGTRERLGLFIHVCQAIQHAHQKGIIHRDIKPSNILVTVNDGVPVPKVIDFGIAKATEERLTDATIYTQLHQFVGTPAYMSPEQAGMSSLDIDTRSDIYSLGVLLYELLAGTTPFDARELLAAGFDAMRRTIREREPVRPSTRLAALDADELTTTASLRSVDSGRLVHQLRGDLDWIVMKCLEKDRGRRYETANGLADDLRRHLASEPVTARPPTAAYRFVKAWRRNRLAFSAGATVLAALAIGAGVSTWQADVAREAQRREAEVNARLVEQVAATDGARVSENRQRLRAEAALQDLQIQQAEELFATDQPLPALGYLGEVLRSNPSNSVAAARLAAAMLRPFARLAAEPMPHAGPVNTAEFSPDGTRVLTANSGNYFVPAGEAEGHAARIWDAATGQPLTPPMVHSNRVVSAHFSPDGSRVVTASADNTARVWDARTGAARTAPLRHRHDVTDARFSPDGLRVVTASRDRTARVWDARTGEPVTGPLLHEGEIWSARFSPDGLRVVTAGHVQRNGEAWSGAVQVWDARTGDPGRRFPHPRPARWADFSPDGSRVVTTSDDGTARIWATDTGLEAIPPLAQGGPIRAAALSPDGLRVALAGSDGAVRVWSIRTGEPVAGPMQHEKPVHHVVFSADGLFIATASQDTTARVWESRTGRPLTESIPHGGSVAGAGFSPDGRRLVTAAGDGLARVWDLRVPPPPVLTLPHPAPVRLARFSPDGQSLLTATAPADQSIRVWDLAGARMRTPPGRHGQPIVHAEFSPDGSTLVTASFDGTARLWNAGTGRAVGEALRHEGEVYHAGFSPDGTRVVTASQDATVRIWDTATGRALLGPMEHKTGDIESIGITGARFSPDGRRLVTACDDHLARIWDAETGRLLASLAHHGGVRDVRFSPDGKRVATASDDRTARVWDAATGEPVTGSLQHAGAVGSAGFSPDGSRVVTASEDNTARLWDTASGTPLTEPLRHADAINAAEFSPDGRRVLTASDDGTARIWDAATGRPLSGPLRHGGAVWTAGFSPDGGRVATASTDDTARVWEAPPVPVPVPDWFLDWCEARVGRRLTAGGTGSSLSFDEQRRRRGVPSGPGADGYLSRVVRWIEADPEDRPLTPLGGSTVADRRRRELAEGSLGSLSDWLLHFPTDADAWLRLADLWSGQVADPDHLAHAAWSARMALRLEPVRAAAWRRLGISQWHAGNADAARGSLERALAFDPEDPEAWAVWGHLLRRDGDPAGALDAFRRARALLPSTRAAALRQEAVLHLAESEMLRELGRTDESRGARATAHRGLGIPDRSPDTPANLVDLSPWYNAALVGAWHPGDGGNDLTGLPQGAQPFGDIRFDSRGVVQLAGEPALKELFPAERTGLELNRRFRRLHALHATGWTEPPGVTIAILRLHYADGRRHDFPIRYGEEVLDWFASAPPVGTRTNAREAWQGTNGAGFRVRLFQSTWENPLPEVEVTRIDYVSQGTACAPFLVGLTLD